MKKTVLYVLMLSMVFSLFSFSALAEDTFSSASQKDFYEKTALTGDALMEAIQTTNAFYLVNTVNPDGSVNSAFLVFGMVKHADKYYLMLGLSDNQSKENLLRDKKGLAVYAKAPTNEEGAKPYAVAGARIWFNLVEDAKLLESLAPMGREGTLFFEVTAVRPLG